jgi:regulator of protease activity HflC (stomatin/prohibitin superfamily)
MKASVAVFALTALIGLSGCTRIGPGHVGITVSNAGDDKGVLDKGVTTGWNFYLPGKTQIIEYPTYYKNYTYTKDTSESKPQNEELQFVTKDGQQGQADVGFTLAIIREKAPAFFVKYKIPGDDLDSYIHGAFRNTLRQTLADEALKYTTDELYFGSKRAELETNVRNAVNKIVNEEGATVGQFGVVNNFRFPDGYVKSIAAKIQALQDAERVDAEKKIAVAEAQKQVAQAKGIADSKIETARGEAESQRVRTMTITPQILEMKRLEIQERLAEKWDGGMPQYMMGSSGAGPTMLLQIPQK